LVVLRSYRDKKVVQCLWRFRAPLHLDTRDLRANPALSHQVGHCGRPLKTPVLHMAKQQ
jgi:hypothetical protein